MSLQFTAINQMLSFVYHTDYGIHTITLAIAMKFIQNKKKQKKNTRNISQTKENEQKLLYNVYIPIRNIATCTYPFSTHIRM